MFTKIQHVPTCLVLACEFLKISPFTFQPKVQGEIFNRLIFHWNGFGVRSSHYIITIHTLWWYLGPLIIGALFWMHSWSLRIMTSSIPQTVFSLFHLWYQWAITIQFILLKSLGSLSNAWRSQYMNFHQNCTLKICNSMTAKLEYFIFSFFHFFIFHFSYFSQHHKCHHDNQFSHHHL